MKALMPIVYYPIKVLFVDDNQEVLDFYDNNKIHCNIQTINDPTEALNILNNQQKLELGIMNKIVAPSEIELTDYSDELMVKKFYLNNVISLISDKSKYDQIGIVVADYQMPDMTGIKMYESLPDKSIKKILLTGKYDLSGAVTSLNNRTIDCYIDKGNDGIVDSLKTFIDTFQSEYFNELTNSALGDLEPEQLPFLADKGFINFFKNKIKDYEIVEYYLIDKHGSFLAINAKNQKFIFVRHTDESLDEFCELYDFNETSSSFFDAIRKRELIPFFGFNVDPIKTNSLDWKNYFHKATKEHNFYWSIIELNATDYFI